MKGIADSLRRRGHPCDQKKLAMLRFIFVFRNFLRMQAFCEVSENKNETQHSEFLFVARMPAAAQGICNPFHIKSPFFFLLVGRYI